MLRILLFLALVLHIEASSYFLPSLNYPIKDFERNLPALEAVKAELRTSGMFLVNNVPNLDFYKERLYEQALVCQKTVTVQGNKDFMLNSLLEDGTVRSTFASLQDPNRHETLQELGKLRGCTEFVQIFQVIEDIMENIKISMFNLLDEACESQRFFQAHSSSRVNPVSSFEELSQYTGQLNHLHIYNKSQDGGNALDFHTDHGLFLLFLPATSLDQEVDKAEFKIKQGDLIVKPQLHESKNTVAVMLGEQVRKVLNPYCSIELKPTLHSLTLKQGLRTWFGAMIVSNEEVREQQNVQQLNSKSLGCSQEMYLTTLAKDSCKKGTQFCWMQCVPVTKTCEEPEKLDCVNSHGLVVHSGMCTDCSLQCVAPPAPTPNPEENDNKNSWIFDHDENFCSGLPSVMFMEGFHLDYYKRANDACIVFLFDGLVADNHFKFFLVNLLTLGLSVFVEYTVYKRKHRAQMSKFVYMSWYVLQIIAGYFVMLLVMTYSTIIFVTSIIGLCIGHLYLNYKDPTVSTHDVCCQYMDDLEEPLLEKTREPNLETTTD